MCCGTERSYHGGLCGCGCGAPSHCRPRFVSKEQRIAKLEEYLEGLREEANAVEEHIAEMKEKK